MLVIPEKIKALFRSDNNQTETHKKFKLTFYEDSIDSLYPYERLFPDEGLFPSEHGEPWLLIENDRIVSESLQITESLSSSEDLTFGSCEGSEMQITVADVIEDVTGKEFTLTVEVGGYEMALGIYTVKSFERQSDRRKRKIIAYDRMSWFNVDVAGWYNELSFPMTLKTFRDSLCEYIGIQQIDTNLLFDSLQISKTIEPKQISGLDVLKAICEINGCFGHIDKTGQLAYIHLQLTGLYPSETLYPEETLYPSETGSDGKPVETIFTYKQPMSYEDYLVEGIDSLVIRQEEGDVGANVGNGKNVYAIEGNFLVYGKSAADLLNIAQSLLPCISGRIYRPASLDCNCMPWIEVGDAVQVLTKDDIVETFVMKRTISGCQNMRDKIEATGSQKREEQFTIQKQIIQLEGKTAIISKNVEEAYVKISDLEKDTESKLSIMSDQITAEVKRATEAEGELSGSIKINAEQIALKVSKGEVSSQISIESGGVNITGNRLTWTATNSTMSADGTLTCKNIKATNGSFSGTITGSTISGGTITGTKIEGNTISGGTIDGTTITGGTITGSEIKAKSISTVGTVAIKVLSAETIDCEGDLNAHMVTVDYLYYGFATSTSDRRLKENIQSISENDALKVINGLNSVTYNLIDGPPGIGFIAQDVEKLLKELNLDWKLYDIGEDGYYTIPYLHFVPILSAAIKALNKEVVRLEELNV